MSTLVRQSNFNGGEIAPGLHARTNLKRYTDSLRLCRNFIPRQEGPISNRPGMLFQTIASDPDLGGIRAHVFNFGSGSLARSFVLEFSAALLNIYKSGVRVKQLVTPYQHVDLMYLKFAQAGQVMTISCLRKVWKELTWTGPTDADWTFTDFAITRAIAAPTLTDCFLDPPAGHPTDATSTAKEWRWVITAVKDGTREESLPTTYFVSTTVLTTNKTIKVTWNAVEGAAEYNVYRGRNGKYGYVGSTPNLFFYDDGPAPVYAEAPPTGRNPFPDADEYPGVVTLHEQRLTGANSYRFPNAVEMSRTADTHNFDRAIPPRAEDAVSFGVVSAQYEEIRNLISMRKFLVAMTNNRVVAVTGSEGVILPDDVIPDSLASWGSSWLDPIVIGDTMLFAQDVGSTLRELTIEGLGNDLTLLAQHFFQGLKIISWCYAHEPFRVIWAVADNGALFSCTYVKQLETWAWAQHDTGKVGSESDFTVDLVEAAVSVPEQNENAVYLFVRRYSAANGWVRCLEKLAPRVGVTRSNGVFLDSARTVFGTDIVNELDHLEGRQVYVLADGVPRGPYTVSAGTVTFPGPANVAHIGLPIVADGGTLDVFSPQQEVRPVVKNIKKVFIEVEDSVVFKAGQVLTDDLMPVAQPSGEDLPANTLYTGLVTVNIESEWDDNGAVYFRHDKPLPLTIMSITRDVEFGGR